jgi:hypothetical protein
LGFTLRVSGFWVNRACTPSALVSGVITRLFDTK